MIVLYIILGALALFFIIWVLYSFFSKHHRLPNESKIWDFQEYVFKEFKFRVDLYRLEQNFIPCNGMPIHIDVIPYAQGAPTIVFVPGTAVYAETYIQFLFELNRDGFNVVGFDPRGHGTSGGLRGDFEIMNLVDEAICVSKYAKERFGGKLAISGSSQGGITAFYAIAKSDIFDAAAINNIADLNGKDNIVLSKFRPPQWALPFVLWVFQVLRAFVVPLSFYLDFSSQKLRNGMSASTLLQMDPRTVLGYTLRVLKSLAYTPMPKPVGDITVPTMVFQGSEDIVFPVSYTKMVYDQLTCKKELIIFEGQPHLILLNIPQEVSPVITKWLREVLSADSPAEEKTILAP